MEKEMKEINDYKELKTAANINDMCLLRDLQGRILMNLVKEEMRTYESWKHILDVTGVGLSPINGLGSKSKSQE